MKFQKAYIKDPNPFIPALRRGIMNVDSNLIFIAGYGWMNAKVLEGSIKLLPVVYDKPVAFDRRNAKDELWAWCYDVRPPLRRAPSRMTKQDDGSTLITSL